MRARQLTFRFLALCISSAPGVLPGQQDRFALREEMIPMRDGVKLYTRIFTPNDQRGELPIMFIRTPYGIGGSTSRRIEQGYGFLARDGYIFAFQDARGKFKSEGAFVMMRQPRTNPSDPKAIDEATDAYDSIEWMTKNLPNNNGRVGMTGVSYPGWLTAVAMMDPHPALKAVSPQASPADMFLGDDFHHNGAFRLSYGFEYAVMMESGKEVIPFSFDTYDTYDWYLRLGSLATVKQKVLAGKDIPTWKDFSERPNYDAFWQRQAMMPLLKKPVTVPNLNVAGWWDQEDFYGPVTIYRELEKHDAANNNLLVVGPWNHGGWMGGEGKSLGVIQFGVNTAEFFRDSVMAPFFAHHLHGAKDPKLPEALVFEAGSNRWRRYDAWPPKAGVAATSYYFRENGRLATEAPRGISPQFDSYVSDPNKPVPYRPRPIPPTYSGTSTWSTWLTDDQRHAASRPDVVVWNTPALDQDLTIAGDIVVTLHAATTGSDADWIVKLIDVYPDSGMAEPRMNGYQFMVANEVFRGRFRKSFAKPEAIVPNAVTPFTVDLHTQSYTFKKGHRVMVQVQSSWFPLIDRNPQTFVSNIFEAKPSDFVAATHRVYRSARYPSQIKLPVVSSVVP